VKEMGNLQKNNYLYYFFSSPEFSDSHVIPLHRCNNIFLLLTN
jgi:hypothetical protein